MSNLTTHTTATSPSGLLSTGLQSNPDLLADVVAQRLIPWASLRRMQPVQPYALRKFLLGYYRLTKAFAIQQQLFPHQPLEKQFGHMQHVRTHVYHPVPGMTAQNSLGWWEVLGAICRQVEDLGWFEINWKLLEDSWTWWLGKVKKGEQKDELANHLAIYLEHIPLKFYGFNCKEDICQYPPIELFHVMFSIDCPFTGVVSASLMTSLGVYDEWDDFWTDNDRNQAWAFIRRIESDPGEWSEPIRWLPEIIRWACHSTRNPILDATFNPQDNGPWYTWDEYQHVCHFWQQAQATINAFKRLMVWHNKDESRLALLFQFLMEGGEYAADLDW